MCKMINFDQVRKRTIKKNNRNWSKIPDHPYRILIIGGTESRKKSSLFNLISHQPHIDKIKKIKNKGKIHIK